MTLAGAKATKSKPDSPSIRPALIDSHCHLVFHTFDSDLETVRSRWQDAGVVSLLHACVEPGEIAGIRALADRIPELRYAVGVHPLDVEQWKPDTLDILRQAASSDSRVVAIGELGLDLFRASSIDDQLRVMASQLDLAVELGLPVIVHCRDAAEPMLSLFRERAAAGGCPRGVMHCWAGKPEEMSAFLDLGFHISFSGIVTFPKADATHACARLVPADRYMVETDSPFLAPVPRRGKRNEPSLVTFVAKGVAKLREVPLATVAEQSTANARALFGLP